MLSNIMVRPTNKKLKELEQLESEDTKQCSDCKKIKSLHEFNFSSKDRKFAGTYCIKCQSKREKENYIFRNYGISLKDYDKMLIDQSGKCKICGTKTPKGRGRFHIDHNHKINGKKGIRGLLCQQCNMMLGNAKDNPDTLIAAAHYLINSKK